MNKSSNVELTDFRNDLVDMASQYSKKHVNRMRVSLPKIAAYKGDKSPAWDAILTFLVRLRSRSTVCERCSE